MKKPTLFQIFLIISVAFFLATRLYILRDNNFHFTTDQGRDAVYVRDIIKNHTLFWKGPETSIRGIFTGPLWYYFLVPGYILTQGHPIAAPLTLIFLNLILLIYLAFWLKNNFSAQTSYLTILALLTFWPFFETSLYGFNPFPAVTLAFLQLTLLSQKKCRLSLLPLILAYNTNLAIALVLTLFQTIVFTSLKLRPKLKLGFPHLSLLLAITSIIFFSISPYYRPWYTVYLPPLLVAALIITIIQSQLKITRPILVLTFTLLVLNFATRYSTYLKPSPDPSLLYNQLKTIDQIYASSANQGFAAYNYTNTFYDYPYQYLFYWYGRTKYDYLPCEYSNYPLSPKELYVPHFQSYLEPRRACDRLKFLIIQSKGNGEDNSDWIQTFHQNYHLTSQTQIGAITIENYEVTPTTPTDFCLWWHRCD